MIWRRKLGKKYGIRSDKVNDALKHSITRQLKMNQFNLAGNLIKESGLKENEKHTIIIEEFKLRFDSGNFDEANYLQKKFKIENEHIYSIVMPLIIMSKKRCLKYRILL